MPASPRQLVRLDSPSLFQAPGAACPAWRILKRHPVATQVRMVGSTPVLSSQSSSPSQFRQTPWDPRTVPSPGPHPKGASQPPGQQAHPVSCGPPHTHTPAAPPQLQEARAAVLFPPPAPPWSSSKHMSSGGPGSPPPLPRGARLRRPGTPRPLPRLVPWGLSQ